MPYIQQNPDAQVYEGKLGNIKNYILYSLGYPVIRVELTEKHLMTCIIEALEIYSEYAANDTYKLLILPVGNGNIVDIPLNINPRYISDVIFERDFVDSMTRGLMGGGYDTDVGVLPLDMTESNSVFKSLDITHFYMMSQYMEDFKKVMGLTRTFEILNCQLVLYPSDVDFDVIGVIYKDVIGIDDAENHTWIKKYSLAKAKMILGTIRSKLSGFSSSGANISADGEALKSEGKEEMEKLLEDLKFLAMPLPIMQGD